MHETLTPDTPAIPDRNQLTADLNASITHHVDRIRLAPLPDYADELRVIETEFLDRTAGQAPVDRLKTMLKFKTVLDGLVEEAQRDAKAVTP